MIFSPFNPVLFNPTVDIHHIYSPSDHIMIECFADISEQVPSPRLCEADGGNPVSSLSWIRMPIGDRILLFYVFRGLPVGNYKIKVGESDSNVIHVTDDEDVLSQTVLLQYRNRSNSGRYDLVSKINGVPFFFDFRIPGGIKDSDWSFGVENRQFSTDNNDVVELQAIDITNKMLTLGYSSGVPAWEAGMINRIFSCDLVYVDGDRYSRCEESTPLLIDSDPSGKKSVYKIMLRQDHCVDPAFERTNRIALRRTPTHLRRTTQNLRKI